MTTDAPPPYDPWGQSGPHANAAYPGGYPGVQQQPMQNQPAAVLPYASPVGPYGVDPTMQWAWQEGPLLVVRKGAWLPHHCVKCGAPAEGQPLKRTLYWHEPWVYLLILPGLLIYAIAAICLRKSGVVHVGLCAAHRSRWRSMVAAGWTLGLGGPVLMVFAAATAPNSGPSTWTGVLLLAGVVSLIAGLVFGVLAPVVKPKRIDPYFLWLKGAGPGFLARLPGVVRQ